MALVGFCHSPFNPVCYQTNSVIGNELQSIINYNFPNFSERVIIKKGRCGLPYEVAFNQALNKVYIIGKNPLEENNTSTIKFCLDTKNPSNRLIYKRFKGVLNDTERKINCLLAAHKDLFIATDEIYDEMKKMDLIAVVRSGMILEQMEYDLKTLLKKKDLSMKSRISILIDILTALITLHEQGIVHLDLNSNNILLNVESLSPNNGRKYHTKIADFGKSEFIGKNIKYRKASLFAAPEIRECRAMESVETSFANCAIDMWSFGVIALLLIGKKETWKAWEKLWMKNQLSPHFSLRSSEIYQCLVNEAITSNLVTIPIKTIVVNVIDNCLKIDPEKRITAIKAKEELLKAKEILSNM